MTDRTRDDGIDDNEPTNEPPPQARPGPTPKDVVERRLRAITRWLVDGHRPYRIFALVTEAAKLERKHRLEALAANLPVPPFVWDSTPPVSPRTVERYMAKVRAVFETEGRELPKKGAEVAGLTWARSNDLYNRALSEKRYATCRMILRDQMEMFGLIGAIKFQLVPPGEASIGPEPDTTHLPESQWTEEQLNRGLADLLQLGLVRVRGQAVTSGGVLPGVAKALGDGTNGANGTNGTEPG
jgi:hypothetical protein